MNIPYVKVLIYSLTFLTYAFSGYGSTLLGNLRDAILAAENVFGDVLENVVTVAQKFKTLSDVFDAAIEENCIYTCPTGVSPKKNRIHVRSANGCGSLGININPEYFPLTEMTACCNEHDMCYDTCNSNKELCDIEFRKCLYKYCDSLNTMTTPGKDTLVKGCKGAAKMLYTSTVTLGCKSYLDAQAKACYCPPETTSSSSTNAKNKRTRGSDL